MDKSVAPVWGQTQRLDFLWLEVTNVCNLQCRHCYSESSPWSSSRDILTTAQHFDLIDEAARLGCRNIQFIGGEPTANPALPVMVERAFASGFEFIEIFTNLVSLPGHLLDLIAKHNINVATSFYSARAQVHDRITARVGSFERTVSNIKRLMAHGVDLRAGIILMDENSSEAEAAADLLKELGVKNVGADRAREFGRAKKGGKNLSQLCGNCWRNSACVGPDGVVAPCIMSKEWSVGSVPQASLTELMSSDAMAATRRRIYEDVWLPREAEMGPCSPYCQPCAPSCSPLHQCAPACSPSCTPCYPYGRCQPQVGA